MAVFTRQDWEWLPIEPSKLSRSSAVSIIVDSCSSRIRLALAEEETAAVVPLEPFDDACCCMITFGSSVLMTFFISIVVIIAWGCFRCCCCAATIGPPAAEDGAGGGCSFVIVLAVLLVAVAKELDSTGSSRSRSLLMNPPGPTVELETSTTPDTLLLPTLARLGDASKPTADPDGEI
uniref:Uncharacterized protein n=1 Tax=Anopheles coluzzii TaxID=1518534 RepID=A0A8W7PNY8_ANOCL